MDSTHVISKLFCQKWPGSAEGGHELWKDGGGEGSGSASVA